MDCDLPYVFSYCCVLWFFFGTGIKKLNIKHTVRYGTSTVAASTANCAIDCRVVWWMGLGWDGMVDLKNLDYSTISLSLLVNVVQCSASTTASG